MTARFVLGLALLTHPTIVAFLPGIAGWYLQGAYYLEEFGEVNGVKQYTLYGRGWSWATWMSGYTFRMYGPMPE